MRNKNKANIECTTTDECTLLISYKLPNLIYFRSTNNVRH